MKIEIFSKTNNSFEGQLPDEKVILLLRRHWFSLLGIYLSFAILAALPFIIYFFGSPSINEWGLVEVYWFLMAIYFIFWWFGLFYRLMLYFLDVWLVTDHRVIDSRQLGFFDRHVSEAHISRVQDITTVVHGLFGTTLDFGDVEIETAGAREKFFFKQIPNPSAVKEAIMNANNQFARSHPGGMEQL